MDRTDVFAWINNELTLVAKLVAKGNLLTYMIYNSPYRDDGATLPQVGCGRVMV